MASFALIASSPSSLLVLPASAAQNSKKGLFDWLNDYLDKKTLVETDPVLQPGDGKPGASPKPSPKKPAPKKSGGGAKK